MRFLALLKAINVSGKNIVPMEKLRACLGEAGCKNVKTYIQSGNIIFEHDRLTEETASRFIEQLLFEKFAISTTALVYSSEALNSLIASNPLPATANPDYFHVTFIQQKAESNLIENLSMGQAENELYIVHDRCIYLYCPNGYGNTKLTNAALEKKLKVTATTRNWRTVLKVQQMLNA